MGKKLRSLSKQENETQVWSFQSKYAEGSIRQVFISHDEEVDDQIRLVIQTRETSSIEILEFSRDDKLYGRTWCPQENRMEEDFDFMQISSCLYTREFVCVGFSNGSVRIYNFPKAKSQLYGGSLARKGSDHGDDEIDDQYYNAMFGDSQEETEEDKRGASRFWLDDPSIGNLPSRLLMKHMGYPVCIREQNGTIYVLYDDGALMSTAVESGRGYNVIRYDETFQGGLYFSVNPRGDKIAVSNGSRKLLVSSLEVRGLGKEYDDGIRSCKRLFESQIFKKSSYQSSKKSKSQYNCLVFEWSSCGEYIYLPGESEVRVMPVNDSPGEIKYFSLGSAAKSSYGEDICIVRAVDYVKGKRVLVSLSLQKEVRVYLLGLELNDIQEVKSFMLRDKSLRESFPVSLDLMLKRTRNSSVDKESDGCCLGEESRENEEDGKEWFLYISSVLNSGELILNKIRMDFETYSKVNLVDGRRSSLQNGDFKENKSKVQDNECMEKSQDDNLLWDDVDVEESNGFGRSASTRGKTEDAKKAKHRGCRFESGLRRLGDDDDELEGEDIDMDDENLGGEEIDVGEEEEYEYENWDKREFGRHIEHLRGRIERLKSTMNSGNESQAPVHPGFTGDSEMLDSLNEENREFLFCWNQSGYISYSIDDDGRPSIDMECYNSMDGPKKLRVYDTKGYNMACIGMDGYLLGRRSKVLENGTVIPSIVDYHIWRTWGRSDKSGWSKTLLSGEDLVSMTCNHDLVAVMTSLRYLRIWRNSGISVSVTKLVGSPVCCVSNDSYLLVVTQREPFYTAKNRLRLDVNAYGGIISGRCNTYEVLFLDVSQETLIYNDTMSVSPETIIKWCGISNKGVPVIQDTSGQTFMLSRQWKNQKENWVPITNFGALESSVGCKYFILGVNDDYFNVLKLPDGLDHPIPIMAKNGLDQNYSTIKIPFNIPILGLPSLRQWMNIIENDPTLNECITNSSISWEVIDELRMKLDLMQGNISMVDEFSCHKESSQYRQYKLQREKLLMRLYMKLVIKQLVEPAFDVVRMFNFPKSFQIALEQAEKSGERILANKINQEIQMRSKYEQERSEKTIKADDSGRTGKSAPEGKENFPMDGGAGRDRLSVESLKLSGDHKSRVPSSTDSPPNLASSPCTNSTTSTTVTANSVRPQFGANNPFNTRTKLGIEEKSPLENGLSRGVMGHGGQYQDEISQTIQYCSDIIKKRKV